jgi:hypothetical protein
MLAIAHLRAQHQRSDEVATSIASAVDEQGVTTG